MQMVQRNQTLDLSQVFESVVSQLQNDRSSLNALDTVGGNGNHGDNVLSNFELVANALRGQQGQDAGAQLRRAADVLQHDGRGATANIYAQGLREAAQRVQGQQGISLNDLLPLLQGLLGGVQQSTNAQPGQGTLLDTLLPAITSFASSRNSGRSGLEAIGDALSAATRGSQQTYNQPALFGRSNRQPRGPWQDPGAASARSLLEGLFRSFTG
jgi:dihydroxyacetone kinase-like protein